MDTKKIDAALSQIHAGLDALVAIYRDPAAASDIKLYAWMGIEGLQRGVKATEQDWRKDIFAAYFPGHRKGTVNRDLGNGYILKAVGKLNYKLDPAIDKVEAVMDAIEKVGNEGAFLADRLVKTKYELAEGEYNKLAADNTTQSEIKALVDSILTITDGSPSLEIVPPKAG